MKTLLTLLLASLLAGVAFSRLEAASLSLTAYGQAELAGSPFDIFPETNAVTFPVLEGWSGNLNVSGADTWYYGLSAPKAALINGAAWGQNFNICSNASESSNGMGNSQAMPVPEPAMIALSGVAAVAIMSGRSRRKKNRLPNDN